MSASPRIWAVVLSYNAFDSLCRVVDGIRNQSYPVGGITIVDNGSAPEKQQRLKAQFGDLDLVLLEENRGVGAGHNLGWKRALQDHGADFIWSLEHDCIPEKDCLEILLDHYERSDKDVVADVCPVDENGLQYDRYDYYLFTSKGWRKIGDKKKQDNYYGGLSFNGLLLPRRTIESIGYLREDFFVGREDIDYFHRIWDAGQKNLRVTSAVVHHNMFKNRQPLKIGRRIYLLPDSNIFRDYYGSRNAIYMLRASGKPMLSLIGRLVLGTFSSLTFRKRNKIKGVIAKWTAFRDGMRGNLGKKEYWFLK